ncbi:hypothetical protein RhiirA1_478023 [Rhizophagus irregularis]|uniref:Uncharacterized protein n=1 Tax=Rhizophagus irregularis TaxID=588596 RepID=A0A2N0QSQ3_9GLOM|nr:hypothetical protein RhiirA1_478023 [Rhizophagus irregularis]
MYGKLYENDKVHSYPTYTFRQNDKILIKFILTDVIYENYAQSKAKDTMPSAPSFDPTYIPPARQEMVSPISHQSSNSKSNTSEIFISSWYAKQNNLLPSINNHNQPALRLRDGTKITFV